MQIPHANFTYKDKIAKAVQRSEPATSQWPQFVQRINVRRRVMEMSDSGDVTNIL